LLEYAAGLNLIVMPPSRVEKDSLAALFARLRQTVLPTSIWLAAGMLYRGDDARRIKRLTEIARDALVPLIAVNDVVCHTSERRALQDVVTCIREHLTMETAGRKLEANIERHLKSPSEMARIFRRLPDAIAETINFLDRCSFSLDELKYEYPDETRVGYATPHDALVAFVKEGVQRRYPNGIAEKTQGVLDHEMAVIANLGYAPYFLTVYDIVQAARARGILCQG